MISKLTIRVCVCDVLPAAEDRRGWVVWLEQRSGRVVLRTRSTQIPAPPGAIEVQPGDLLPVTDAERDSHRAGIARLARLAGHTPADYEAMLLRGGSIDDDIRSQRRDPSHDRHCRLAPIDLTAAEADAVWLQAITAGRTLHSQVVVRRMQAGHWLAWTGLGSLIQPVRNPEGLCAFAERAQAIEAALKQVAAARAELTRRLTTLLDGWQIDPAGIHRESGWLAVFGVVSVPPAVTVREGVEGDGRASWDLPAREQIAAQVLPTSPPHGRLVARTLADVCGFRVVIQQRPCRQWLIRLQDPQTGAGLRTCSLSPAGRQRLVDYAGPDRAAAILQAVFAPA